MDVHLDPRLRSTLRTTAATSSPHLPSIPLTSLSENPVRLPLPTRSPFSILSDASQQQHQPQQSLQPQIQSHPQHHHPYYHLPPAAAAPSIRPPLVDSHADANDPKRPRACEACRGLKVRCETDPGNPDGPCKRCAKARRNCVITTPTRKRQKKTDSRVAELEKKVDALSASLQAAKSGRVGHGESQEDGSQRGDESFEADRFRTDDAQALTSREARRPSWLGESENHVRSPSHSAAARTSPAASNIPGLKRKYSELSQNTTASPDTPALSSLPSLSAERSQPGGDNSQGVYPFLIPKSLQHETRSVVKPDPTTTSTAVTGRRYEHADVIDRQVLSAELATQLFDRYVSDMAPLFPAVVFPPGTAAAEVRKTKPLLFLAILSVGAGVSHPPVQEVLSKEVMKDLADRIICNGEKSMELIHALQVVTIWYLPPRCHDELKFYQLIHIAAVMAIDLGMGRKLKSTRFRFPCGGSREHPWKRTPAPKLETAESRRTWLTCYFLSANASMALRRPNLIQWSSYTAECLELLESSPDALPSDRQLCHWVRVQHLAEDIGSQLSLDDSSTPVGLSDPKTVYALKTFDLQLSDWQAQLPKNVDTRMPPVMSPGEPHRLLINMQGVLEMGGHAVKLYSYDISMRVAFSDDEECGHRCPDESTKDHSEPPTQAEVAALTTCLSASHEIIRIFLDLGEDTVRLLPIIHFVRVAYALAFLTKLYFAATASNSELGKVINREHLKVEENLEGLLDMFRKAAEGNRCKPASKFLMVLLMLKNWFLKHQGGHCKSGHHGKMGNCCDNSNSLGNVGDGCPMHKCSLDTRKNDNDMASSSRSENGQHQPGTADRSTDADHARQCAFRSEGMPVQPTYPTANTPLQLLSEVAMGNSNRLVEANGLHNPNNSSPRIDGQSGASSWYQAGPQNGSMGQPLLDYSAGNGASYHENGQPPITSFGLANDAEMTAAMGDGFDQAMMSLGEGDFSSIFLNDVFPLSSADDFQNGYDGWE